ncbi:MAG: site-specific integrase [Actinomycetota bacterium]|nr:site-specific integrase [Actinomycetota bacterium]
MQDKANPRRSYGTGSMFITRRADGTRVYIGKFRAANGQQVKRRIGPVRTPHQPDGLTKAQAEARLRDLIATVQAATPVEHARTLEAAADAWLTHLEATGTKASSVRAYRAALDKWFLPTLKTRSLDRIAEADVEHAMRQMRAAGLADKTVRNYVGVLRALFNYAADKRRRWTRRNPVTDVELPKIPTYTEIRYLTPTEVWALVDAARPGEFETLDRAMYLTAAMTGLRIGELQALDWRSVDFVHARIRVRRTWDRKAKTFTTPKSRRSERSVPMPDVVAGALERLFKTHQPDAVEPEPESLVFGHPVTGEALGHRLMYERLRATLKAAGLDEAFGFHSLRHSYGTALAAQGVPMRTLQEWMGHKDIQTTQRYADYCPNPGERDVVEAAFAAGTNPGTNLRAPVQN